LSSPVANVRKRIDLSKDIGERTDLASQRQDVARRLRPLIAAWENEVDTEAKTNAAPRTATQ
jgi:hypothetical protein